MRYSKHELSTISMLYSPPKIVNGNLPTMATFFCPQDGLVERFGGGDSALMVGMLVVLLRGVHFGFWSHLGCSGKNAIIFSREGLV